MASASSPAHSTWRVIRTEPPARLVKDAVAAVTENRLMVYASAIAYRGFVTMFPLVLLGLALLGALGLESTWEKSIKPSVDPHLQEPVARALNFTVEQILSGDSTGLIAFAALWSFWNMTLAVRIVMQALNEIHDVRDRRPALRRIATAAWLALATGTMLVTALLVLAVAPLIGAGVVHDLFAYGRWLVVPVLLAFTIGLLYRFAPAERPETEWASAGSGVVIVVWLVASGAFLWWTTVANYRSAVGNLTVLLTLTLYIFISSSIFLVGAQLDELLRKRAHGERR
jgi:membrane protein